MALVLVAEVAYGSGGGGCWRCWKNGTSTQVVMEVLAFNFHQHLEILPHQLDSLDQDQQNTSLLVVEEEFLTLQNQGGQGGGISGGYGGAGSQGPGSWYSMDFLLNK